MSARVTRIMNAWADFQCLWVEDGHVQGKARGAQSDFFAGRRQDAIVANTLDAGRQYMQQEAAHKFLAIQPDHAFAAMIVGACRERHLLRVDRADALVADRGAVSVTQRGCMPYKPLSACARVNTRWA
jgi:hypothetical protein